MDVSAIKPVSDKIFLADVYPAFLMYETDDNRENWAWVVIRKANEADNLRRSEYQQAGVMRYLDKSGNVVAEAVQPGNPRERIVMEVYWTLEQAGNLTRDGEPLFEAPARSLTLPEFVDIWHSLPLDVSAAIYAAVLAVNTAWLED